MFNSTETTVIDASVKRSNNNTPTHTLISRDTEIVGDIHFSGELIIEGRVRGSIFAEDVGDPIVSLPESGTVEGDIIAPSAVINGLVHGNVHCSKHVELASKASVVGDIRYSMIEMVLGSEVNGKLERIIDGGGGAPLESDTPQPNVIAEPTELAEPLDRSDSGTP
ncbi:polymer-forming cytoskeletal protein [Gammaproteobacteria bacterium]|jgi:cytoskeletal protein CcmA (bactofilin family)|nr:polymer-forming cytoskeletal protein [Gammaproteobacteria bacterium]MDB2375072.1 polymer-forming cytoskeletal protein [Gammaproteobacteria bacterium]